MMNLRQKDKLTERKKRVVIAGASFAGLSAAQSLGPQFDVTVIEPRSYFEFIPNIHELISGFKRSPDILRFPYEPLFDRLNVTYVKDRLESLSSLTHRVVTSSGEYISYDYLIIAIGSTTNTNGIEGVEEYAYTFKSGDECCAISKKLHELNQLKEKSSLVIIGGGLEGIEALGEILRKYRLSSKLSVHLLDSGDRLLNGYSSSIDHAIREHCKNLPVTFHFETKVIKIEPHQVVFDNGKPLKSSLTIWTGGIKPPDLLKSLGLASEKGQWAPVRATLESQLLDDVFIIGDAAALIPRLSKQAYHGISMGAFCAQNLKRQSRGKPILPFKPQFRPLLVSFGDLDTFMITQNMVFSGTALAVIKEGIFQKAIAQFDHGSYLKDGRRFVNRYQTLLNFPPLTTIRSLKNLRILHSY